MGGMGGAGRMGGGAGLVKTEKGGRWRKLKGAKTLAREGGHGRGSVLVR